MTAGTCALVGTVFIAVEASPSTTGTAGDRNVDDDDDDDDVLDSTGVAAAKSIQKTPKGQDDTRTSAQYSITKKRSSTYQLKHIDYFISYQHQRSCYVRTTELSYRG